MNGLPDWTAEEARQHAERILGRSLDGNDSTVCPGDETHSTSHGRPDFRIFLTGRVPYGHCFHTSCYARTMEFNRELWRRLFGGRRGGVEMAFEESGLRRVKEVIRKRQDYNPEALRMEQRAGMLVNREWLWKRSPVDPAKVTTADFLDVLYEPGERVLCFTTQHSQGDYGFVRLSGGMSEWCELGGCHRDANVRLGTRETPTALRSAKEGAWFLAQPVDGRWHLDANLRDRSSGLPKWSRRSKLAVTDWRWLVLESDSAPTDLWLNFLVQLKLRVAALYTSGGRSVHALVRVNALSKAQWDQMRDVMSPVLSRLGADPAAMSAVRLTRLPGCYRRGKAGVETWRDEKTGAEEKRPVYHRYERPLLQELLYLDPRPQPVGIANMPVRRTGEEVANGTR